MQSPENKLVLFLALPEPSGVLDSVGGVVVGGVGGVLEIPPDRENKTNKYYCNNEGSWQRLMGVIGRMSSL